MRIETVADSDYEQFSEAVVALLDSHARELGFKFDARRVALRAAAPDGRLVGGLFARELLGWLFVQYLAVDECARGTGVGKELLERAESEAQEFGLAGVYLDTFSFQAPDFYEKCGYTEMGRLPAIDELPHRIWYYKLLNKGRNND